jgi:hypothetical protein
VVARLADEEGNDPEQTHQLTTRAPMRVAARSAAILVRELIAQAIAATPRERAVVVTVGPDGAGEHATLGSRVIIDDSGTSLPKTARRGMIGLEVEPGTFGRPSAIPLYIAAEIAACQGAILELGDSKTGGMRVSVTFPKRLLSP